MSGVWLQQGSEVCELSWMSTHAWRRVEQRKMGQIWNLSTKKEMGMHLGKMFKDLKSWFLSRMGIGIKQGYTQGSYRVA